MKINKKKILNSVDRLSNLYAKFSYMHGLKSKHSVPWIILLI